MQILNPEFKIETELDGDAILRKIEQAGRICYQSDHKITPTSAPEFVRRILKRGHHSVIEHDWATVRVICDRGITHEIVRHRLASYSQESTRFCNYLKERFGEEIKVIDVRPHCKTAAGAEVWLKAMQQDEENYAAMIEAGEKPEIARSVLPNSLKTEIVMSANLREWRHFFTMRAAPPAHPQMRELACPMLAAFRAAIPILFDDVGDVDCA